MTTEKPSPRSSGDPDRIAVVFIAGAGRSGSTLLECMLGQLPGVFPAGEVTHIWDRGFLQDQLCGCGEPFSRCPLWRRVIRAAFGERTVPVSRLVALRDRLCSARGLLRIMIPGLRSSRFRSDLREYGSFLVPLYRAIREVSGCDVVVDSSKYPPELFLLRLIEEIDLSVVHLVRDSHAVVYAWQKRKVRPEIHWKEEHMPRYPAVQTAVAWSVFNGLIGSMRGLGPRYYLVRYEDLVAAPSSSVRAVCHGLGLPDDGPEFLDDHEVLLRPNHTVSGNPIRFRTGWVPIRPDSEWLERTSRAQRALVSLLTRPHRKRYGYVDRPGSVELDPASEGPKRIIS